MSGPASPSGPRHSDLASAAPVGQRDIRTSPLASVCSEIGRGHPSYLDSVLLALAHLRPGEPAIPCLTVPQLCTGTSGLAWSLARTAYLLGSQGGPATWLYNHLRSADSKPSGLQLALLGSSLRRTFAGYDGICIVDHPLLARILAPVCRVAYLHCETAAPGLAAVPNAWRTLVPLQATSVKLQARRVDAEALTVTGLIIEPELVTVAETSYTARLQRLQSERPLTVGLFISGARPRPHVNRIVTCVESLAMSGHKSILFWGPGMFRAVQLQADLVRRGVPEEAARVIWSRHRRDETTRTAGLFPDLDVMVAAAHERTNWAVGLGLPMFALLPHIGPFARENFEFAFAQEVCLPVSTEAAASSFGPALDALRRDGALAAMARAGWGKHAINGAEAAARLLRSAAAQAQPSM